MALIYPGGKADTAFNDGTTTSGWQPESFLYGADVVIPSSGTVTQLGFFGAAATGTVSFKIGLYTSAGVLVGQSTSSSSSGTLAWLNSGAVSLSVSAGTYYVLVSASNSDGRYGYDTTGNGTYATEAYATAMAATESLTIGGDVNLQYGVRLDFTAGGTDATVSLTGASGTFSAGTVSAAGIRNATIALTGASGAFSSGTVAAAGIRNAAVALIGASGAFSSGAVGATGGVSASTTLSGASGSFSAGAVGATAAGNASVALVGASAAFNVGLVSGTAGAQILLAGATGNFSAGTVAASGAGSAVAPIVGATGVFSPGTVGATGQQNATIALVGAPASFSPGLVGASGAGAGSAYVYLWLRTA